MVPHEMYSFYHHLVISKIVTSVQVLTNLLGRVLIARKMGYVAKS